MRLLLASSASHDPPRGGSTRGNLAWLARLAESGHSCRIVAGTESGPSASGSETVLPRGIGLTAVPDAARRSVLRAEIGGFRPDWVLVSSEDLSHSLLEEAHRSAPGRVVYLAHTPQFYPFGPAAWNPEARAAELVAASAGVVAIGRFTADYIRRHAGCRAEVIHPPVYGQPPFRDLGASGGGRAVAMINPCDMKGAPLFAELARRLPVVPFAALPGWGTSTATRRQLDALPNFTWLSPCRDIEQMLERARILLVPSLWIEGFGLIVVEAMLRGIPVLAANEGGLREAKLGTRFLLPVRPIERFSGGYDDRHMPLAIVPPQDIEPWAAALSDLLTIPALYETESTHSRGAALDFVDTLDASDFERYLLALSPGKPSAVSHPPNPAVLTAEKRALLLERLRKRVR